MRFLIMLAALLAWPLFMAWSAQPYLPDAEPRVEDRFRWSELEALLGLGFEQATLGVGDEVWFSKKGELGRFDGIELERYFLSEEVGMWKAVRYGVDSQTELYNLESDLGEEKNVAKKHPEMTRGMERLFRVSSKTAPYFPYGGKRSD